MIELNACVVPDEKMAGRKQYVLRLIRDPNYSVGFVEKMESKCLVLQDSRSTRVVSALRKAQIQDGYIAYPWEMKMKEALSIPNSSSFLSMFVLPRVSDPVAYRYNSLEDTLAKANSWLNSSQVSGVPIQFMNVQTEGLLTKIGKDVSRCLEIAMAKKGTRYASSSIGVALGGSTRFNTRAKTVKNIIMGAANNASETIYAVTNSVEALQSNPQIYSSIDGSNRLNSTLHRLDGEADNIQNKALKSMRLLNKGLKIMNVVTVVTVALNMVFILILLALAPFSTLCMSFRMFKTLCWILTCLFL